MTTTPDLLSDDHHHHHHHTALKSDDDNTDDGNDKNDAATNGGGDAKLIHNMDDDDDDDDDEEQTLKQLASMACKRVYIGTAVMPKPLFEPDVEDYDASDELRDIAHTLKETKYARVCRNEFNAIIVEHHMKWAPLCVSEPGPLPNEQPCDRLGRYDFHTSDRIVDWAIENDMAVKGHVLVWAASSPKFLKDFTPAQLKEQLKRHIFTTMAHFRDRIHVWDVVNEPLAPDGSLAENVFLKKLGPQYIDWSFEWAHQADPTAQLLLNENKVEGIGTAKSEAFYTLMKHLKQEKKLPIHGVGLQAHFNAAGTGRQRPPTPYQVKQQIRRLGDLGLTVNLSEMDVRVSQLPAHGSGNAGVGSSGGGGVAGEPVTMTSTTVTTTTSITTAAAANNNNKNSSSKDIRQLAQRQIFHDICAAALSEPACDGIWLWGFTDRHTWVTHFYYDDEPLIFDEEYQRKEAYYGVRDAIASICPGGNVGGGVGVGGEQRQQTVYQYLKSEFDEQGNPWGHEWRVSEPEGGEIMKTDGVKSGGGVSSSSGDARPDWQQEAEGYTQIDLLGDSTTIDSVGVSYDQQGNVSLIKEDGSGCEQNNLPPIT